MPEEPWKWSPKNTALASFVVIGTAIIASVAGLVANWLAFSAIPGFFEALSPPTLPAPAVLGGIGGAAGGLLVGLLALYIHIKQ